MLVLKRDLLINILISKVPANCLRTNEISRSSIKKCIRNFDPIEVEDLLTGAFGNGKAFLDKVLVYPDLSFYFVNGII